MSGSSIGKIFTVTNFGESHGPAIGAVVDGCPPKFELSAEDIQKELDRRKPGTSRHVTQRKESDTVEILSGVFEGKTTGTPIALLIRNEDQKSEDYSYLDDRFRPGHADWTYYRKYKIRDYRGGGRSSARLTAPTVAAGAIAKKWLSEVLGVHIRACLINLGGIELAVKDWEAVDNNSFFCADPEKVPELEKYLDEVRKSCDSVGAEALVEVINVPVGIGNPIYDKLDAEIAYAFMGLNAVKGVEIGAGFKVKGMRGSENSDQMSTQKPGLFLTNNSGGILGGISSGADIQVKVAIKPTPSIAQPMKTITQDLQDVTIQTRGRHDPCVGIRAVPVLEALMAIVLMDQILQRQAQCTW